MSRRVVPARPALVWLMLLLALASMTPRGAIAASERRVARTMLRSGMVRIPAGAYRPPFTAPAASSIRVAAFHLDRTVVTRAAFDRFVRAHPDWNRASVDSSLVEPGYLREWASAGHVSRTDDAGRPVTRVSWHAASAYCAAQGKRLPTTAEWEYAATASESARDGSSDPSFRSRLLALYSARRPGSPGRVGSTFRNAYGVDDMHGLVWELTADVGAATLGQGAHHATGNRDAHDHSNCAAAAVGVADPADYSAFLRYTVRRLLTSRTVQDGLGFRCAWGA